MLTDEEFARMTPEERRLYIDLLKAFAARKWAQMSKGERQMKRAAMLGVRLTEFNPN